MKLNVKSFTRYSFLEMLASGRTEKSGRRCESVTRNWGYVYIYVYACVCVDVCGCGCTLRNGLEEGTEVFCPWQGRPGMSSIF